MSEIDNKRFGQFLAQQRKRVEMTQKQLAEKLCVSDKAVSKWERGLSLPDIALLMPLAEILGVTTTELLRGQKLEQAETLTLQEVETLVNGSLELSAQEKQQRTRQLKRNAILFMGCAALAMVEVGVLAKLLNLWNGRLFQEVLWVEGLCFLLGGWFCFGEKRRLPDYYDQNKISSYSSGVFRMNMAGLLYFNNRNWPYIVKAGKLWLLGAAVIFPLAYLVVNLWLGAAAWQACSLFVTLPLILGMFVPMIVVGKKYE